jgi:subtilisin family serine protease
LRAEGRQFVYGFLLLRVPADEALQRKLAGLEVELLGPHDDHHKARLPVASLQAIAALPDVEWVGVSAPEQKLSSELTAVRGARGQAAVVEPAESIPIVINLFEGDDNGNFRRQLEAAGAALGEYHAGLHFYRAVATGPAIDRISALDFVLFVELIGLTSPHHDLSTPLVDADLIRPGTTTYGIPRFSGSPIPVGIMDTGFMMGAPDGHDDLYFKDGCGRNFTEDGLSTFTDEVGHGTHVLGTIAGTGSADSRYRGMAPGVGLPGGGGIRAQDLEERPK